MIPIAPDTNARGAFPMEAIWEDENGIETTLLFRVTRRAAFRMATHYGFKQLEGKALADFLDDFAQQENSGVARQDWIDEKTRLIVPALTRRKDGVVVECAYYTDGELRDPGPGVPAVPEHDSAIDAGDASPIRAGWRDRNGIETVLLFRATSQAAFRMAAHPGFKRLKGKALADFLDDLAQQENSGVARQNGVDRDSGCIVPALTKLKDGAVVECAYYTDGKLRDPRPGVPAAQKYDSETADCIRAASHYEGGSSVLSNKALKRFNETGDSRKPLPHAVTQHQAPGLIPGV